MVCPFLPLTFFVPDLPRIVFLEQPTGWVQPTIALVQVLVGLFQAFVLWKLNYYIFRRSAEQKMLEREADWFHETVIRSQLPEVDRFFSDMMTRLSTAVAECARFKITNSIGKFDESAAETLGAFTNEMIPVRRSLINRMNAYDIETAQKLADIFLELEEEVTQWFDVYRRTPETEARSALFGILSRKQNEIYSELRRFELSRWNIQEQKSLLKSVAGR